MLKNICFSIDENYAESLSVAIVSILKNSSSDDEFNFFILTNNLLSTSRYKIKSLKNIKDFNIEFIYVDVKDFEDCPLTKHFTIPAYFRFKLASIFKNLDKILYLDCDLIIQDSLDKLYNINIDEYYAAMAPDAASEENACRLNINGYYNSGVSLINLKKWREDNIEEKLFQYTKLNKEKIVWVEQDVLNVILEGKIKPISKKWNFQFLNYSEEKKTQLLKYLYLVKIIHFSGRFKPWNLDSIEFIYDKYYKYLKHTPWNFRYSLYSLQNKVKVLIKKNMVQLYQFDYEQIDAIVSKQIKDLYSFNYAEVDAIVSNKMKDCYK